MQTTDVPHRVPTELLPEEGVWAGAGSGGTALMKSLARWVGDVARQGALGAAAVAAMTAIGVRLGIDPTTVTLAYIVILVLQSLWAGFAPAMVVAVEAIVCLDYFLAPPLYSLELEQTDDWAALIAFTTIAFVITRLTSSQRRALKEIRGFSDRLRLVVDTIPALVWSARPDGTRDFFSQRWLEYTGFELDQALGAGWSSAIHPDDAERHANAWRAAMATGEPLESEIRLRRRDGVYRWFLIRAVPLRDADGTPTKWYGTSTDIQDRRQAEETIRERERLLREQASLLDLTHDTIFLRDANDVITYWNRGAEMLYGWKSHEALGRITHELLQTVFPAPIGELRTQMLATDRWEGELIHTKRDGTQAVVASRWSVSRDESGTMIGVMETNNDITTQRRAEEGVRMAQTELAHAGRIMVMGEMAASIAHEVYQPLSGVVLNANASLRWLGAQTPNLEEARDAVQRIIRDGKRASDVIGRIRALSKKGGIEKEPFDLNAAVQDVIALAQGELRRARIALRTDLQPGLPAVVADRVQVQQVVLNLLMNAIEAMAAVEDDRRTIVITTRQDEDHRVRVSVKDAGIGLDRDNANRIFDAFYTTKREGMGMGLSISRTIVENHGGRLWAEPNDGAGTTFQFTV
jgi:PAS domain S-box-containing protein